MTEKRFKVAVYDDKATNGFAVLDLQKPNSSKRLKYENVYIGSKEGCEIVCKFGNELAEENEQIKKENKKLKQVNEMLQMDLVMTERKLTEENEELKQQLKEEQLRTTPIVLDTHISDDDFKRIEEMIVKHFEKGDVE